MYANRKGGKSFFVAFVQCLFLWITYNFINAIYPNGTDTDMNISPRDLSAGDNEPKPKRGWGCCEKWGGFNNINLICLSGAVMCWAFLLFSEGCRERPLLSSYLVGDRGVNLALHLDQVTRKCTFVIVLDSCNLLDQSTSLPIVWSIRRWAARK